MMDFVGDDEFMRSKHPRLAVRLPSHERGNPVGAPPAPSKPGVSRWGGAYAVGIGR